MGEEMNDTIYLIFVKSFCPACEGSVQVVGATKNPERADEIKSEFEKKFEIVYVDEMEIE